MDIEDIEDDVVWSVGDECRARYSGDRELYPGVIKKLRHLYTGQVVAVIKFTDYDSDDLEEVDVKQLQKIRTARHERLNTNGNKDKASEGGGGGFFKPLTGTESLSRLEEKYGHDSDSDCEERSSSADWISPTPYQTKGKVSDWKVRSPAKSSPPPRKTPVVQVRSPRKKPPARRNVNSQTEKKNEKNMPNGHSSPRTAMDQTCSPDPQLSTSDRTSCCVDDDRDVSREADHSAFSLTNKDDLFQGFDEDDMEKPKFSFPAPSEKVPFSLDDNQSVQIPAALNQYLRDYQREGIQFLYSHYKRNKGAVLGDDMGLGKTVQVIGFLSAIMGKQGNRQDVLRQKPRFIRMMSDTLDVSEGRGRGPVLIIGPGSVLYNWLEELDTWAHFTVRKYHGVDKASCLADVDRGKVEVVVTTFETCRDNVDALNGVKWDAVIADEVHRIKGFKAQTTRALRKLKCIRRYGLTGTALQNNMSELWCILDWAQPNILGSADTFEEDFVRPIELGQKQNATKRELAVARKKKEEFATVRSQMLLRRTKKIIADQLPVKRDRVVFCRLAPLQVSVYQAVLSHHDLQMVLRSSDRCDCGSGAARGRCCYKKSKSGVSPQSVMFTFMHVLLKASNHIALLIPHANMSKEQTRQARQLCKIAFRDHPEFVDLARDAAFRTLSDPKYCGKMKVLHGMLSVFAKSHSKVLVFSYSTRLLDILEQHVISEGHEYRRIDGTVTGRRRQEIVREFNADPNIFLCLVSTKAGGLGLNMTGANKVVIFDPNWNPSHDLQAQDRAYRIGQRRDVEVYRLISAGSIEENIYLRQVYKQQLDNVAIGTENARRYFRGIQGDAENKGELFGIKNMFRLHTGDSCLTVDILHRNAKMEADIGGFQMADYIPSWREQQKEQDDAREDESDDERVKDDDSSEEETLKAFKDLFDPASEEEEQENEEVGEEQTKSQKKQKQTTDNEPQPSTSGLQKQRKATPCTSRSTSNHHSSSYTRTRTSHHDSDSNSSCDEQVTHPSRPTTRQRKASKSVGSSSLFDDETSATKVLSFLDDGDESVGGKGKALRSKGQASVKSKGRVSDRTDGTALQVPAVSMEDSMVTPSFSSVTSVFEQYGVIHVHDNPQVVGGSRVEDHMTRCAMHDVFELSTNTQAPAAFCDPMSQPSEEEDQERSKAPSSNQKAQKGKTTKGRTPSKDHNSARTVDHGRWHLLVGQTPSAIRKKQWNQLREQQSCQDNVALAQRVLVASPEERLALLKGMYRKLHDQALRGTLDTILTKPAEPEMKPAERTNKATTKARAAKAKTQGQSQKGKRKAEPKVTKGKKASVRQKPRARGLLYDDDDDTQLSQPRQTNPRHLDNDPDSDDSGFDIGAKISPGKNKSTPRKRRGGTAGTGRTQSVVPVCDRVEKVKTRKYQMCWKDSDSEEDVRPHNAASFQTEDVDGLLSKLGREPGDNETCHIVSRSFQKDTDAQKACTVAGRKRNNAELNQKSGAGVERVKTSVLDDIFSDPEDCQVKKRKPPPRQKQKQQTEVPQRANEQSSKYGIAGPSRLQHQPNSPLLSSEQHSSSDIFSDLMNNSTLRDDDVDCFGEPNPWKKRHRTPTSPAKKLDRLIQKSNDRYRQLFESGRLVKKRDRDVNVQTKYVQQKDVIEIKKESSDIDPSGSLFS